MLSARPLNGETGNFGLTVAGTCTAIHQLSFIVVLNAPLHDNVVLVFTFPVFMFPHGRCERDAVETSLTPPSN